MRNHASGHMLEVFVGHATWAMMLRREGLSIIHNIHIVIHAHYTTNTVLPKSVRTELFHIKSLLLLFRSMYIILAVGVTGS